MADEKKLKKKLVVQYFFKVTLFPKVLSPEVLYNGSKNQSPQRIQKEGLLKNKD